MVYSIYSTVQTTQPIIPLPSLLTTLKHAGWLSKKLHDTTCMSEYSDIMVFAHVHFEALIQIDRSLHIGKYHAALPQTGGYVYKGSMTTQ